MLILLLRVTPIISHKTTDLRPWDGATRFICALMKPGTVIIYDSTVYPGVISGLDIHLNARILKECVCAANSGFLFLGELTYTRAQNN